MAPRFQDLPKKEANKASNSFSCDLPPPGSPSPAYISINRDICFLSAPREGMYLRNYDWSWIAGQGNQPALRSHPFAVTLITAGHSQDSCQQIKSCEICVFVCVQGRECRHVHMCLDVDMCASVCTEVFLQHVQVSMHAYDGIYVCEHMTCVHTWTRVCAYGCLCACV